MALFDKREEGGKLCYKGRTSYTATFIVLNLFQPLTLIELKIDPVVHLTVWLHAYHF